MNVFTNLKIAHKIFVAFALALVVVSVSGYFTYNSLDILTSSVEANKASIRAKELNAAMLDSVIQQENALRGYAMLGRDELLDEYRQNQASFSDQSKEFGETAKDPEQRARHASLEEEVRALNDDRFAKLISMAARSETRAQAQEISGRKQLTKVRALIAAIDKRQSQIISDRRAEQLTASDAASTAVMVGAAITALVAMAMGLLLTRTIAVPLSRMTGTMTRLAHGELEVEISATDRRDEIGEMAKTVLVFKENAVAKQAADRAKAKSEAELMSVVETMVLNLGELRERNLTSRVSDDFPPAYAILKESYNEAINQVEATVQRVAESASNIRTGSDEIAEASDDLARRTESNAASLEETSAALTQIDLRLKATATASAQTVRRADQAIATVDGGRATAEEAVAAMGRVSESAKGIDSVIEGLDKIAFQTRVLAMNAAVEAGRAGDAGRGFAVVADLVSALAMRAEEEAKRARDQLSLTQTDIVTAVHAVQKVDGALANISGDVDEVHKLLGTMAEDTTAQSTAITQISAAIGAMDQSTQQNAAMVEETSAAARTLTAEVGSLAQQAAMFKTGKAIAAPVMAAKPVRGSPTPPARTHAPKPRTTTASVPYRSPVKALPTNAKIETGSDDDWNSF